MTVLDQGLEDSSITPSWSIQLLNVFPISRLITILDEAFVNFEDTIDLLKSGG